MSASVTIRLSRGFDAQGVWAPLVVGLPVPEDTLPSPAAAGLAPLAAAPIPVYPGEAPPNPQGDAPVLVACLKLMAVLVALGGAYLSGLFLLGSPGQAAPPGQPLARPAALHGASQGPQPLLVGAGSPVEGAKP